MVRFLVDAGARQFPAAGLWYPVAAGPVHSCLSISGVVPGQ